MVVAAISGQRFIPQEVYGELYDLDQDSLERQHCPPGLSAAYLDLRKQLTQQYHRLLQDPDSLLYDPIGAVCDSLSLPPLPRPAGDASEIQRLQHLLGDRQFLCCLRTLGEIKMSLDQQQRHTDATTESTPIYAKTVLQLDGTITNTYTEALLSHPHCPLILQTHQYNIQASEQQWHSILNFLISLLQGTMQRPLTSKNKPRS